jgi:hypothetical protein
MDLRRYLTAIAQSYDRQAGLHGPAQALLRSAPEHFEYLTPAGYIVIGSGGKGTATFTPWFGFFDSDETNSPEDGLYVAYLFAADLNHVSLTVMQGITTLGRRLGRRQARARLAKDAVAVRTRLQAISLRSSGFRQLAYEASCVLALTYSTTALPKPPHLEGDLHRFLRLHQLAIDLKRGLLQTSPGEVSSLSAEQRVPGDDPLRDFKPKNEADYVARLVGQTLVKTRRHERLIRQYGEWLTATWPCPQRNTLRIL